MSVKTSRKGSDTYVISSKPGTNFDGSRTMNLGEGYLVRRGILNPDYSLPVNAVVTQAVLRLIASGTGWDVADNVDAYQIDSSYKMSTVTWNTKPTYVADASPPTDTVVTTELDIDITEIVNNWQAGQAKLGIYLMSSDNNEGDSNIRGYLSSTIANRPLLTITYTIPAPAPVDLRPADGGVVADEDPIFTWAAGSDDNEDGLELGYCQLQIATIDGNDDPIWSSSFHGPDGEDPVTGWVALTSRQYNLQDYTENLAAGTVYAWRVREKGADGVASAWSDEARITYRALRTVTVSAPTATVDTTTPTYSWSLSAGTITAVEIDIYRNGELIRTKHLAGAVTTWDLDPDIIQADDDVIRADFRVWDDYARVDVVGAPGYATATNSTTYDRDSGTTGTTALTATPLGPGVVLHWSRASEPDSFAIIVDGDIIAVLEPAQCLRGSPSAGQWETLWFGLQPHTALTVEVAAVVAGQYSLTNDTELVELDCMGIYFALPGTEDYVNVIDESGSSTMERSTDLTTHNLMGENNRVAVKSASYGWEGVASGYVVGRAERDLLDSWLSLSHTTWRLVWDDYNLEVILGSLTVQPDVVAGYFYVAVPWVQV